MTKYVIGGIAAVLVIAGAVYFLTQSKAKNAPASPQVLLNEPILQSYASTTFSVQYPEGFRLDENYVNTSVNEKKPIAGVRFFVPESMSTSTNLSSDSYVSIETLPRAKNCTGDIYLKDNVRAERFDDAGVAYSLASTSGAAAENMYEEFMYARAGSSPCIAVRYFIHTTSIENYLPAQAGAAGTVRAYDRPSLIEAFDTVRRSLNLTATSSNTQ